MTNLQFRQYVYDGDVEKVREGLQDPEVDPSDEESLALRLATDQEGDNFYQITKMIWEDGRSDPTEDYCLAFINCCEKNYIDIVKEMLKDERLGSYMSSIRMDLIHTVVTHNRVEIIELLIDDGRLDFSTNFNNAIRLAKKENKKEIVDILMELPSVIETAFKNKQTEFLPQSVLDTFLA